MSYALFERIDNLDDADNDSDDGDGDVAKRCCCAAMSKRCETTDLPANLLIHGCIHTWQNGLRLCICEEAGERDS